jgi:transposase, IS5 family
MPLTPPMDCLLAQALSQLKRSFGLRRTRLRRLAGARTRVGLGIFAYNLQPMTVLAA